jgi:superfamily II DNA or RNA helicase
MAFRWPWRRAAEPEARRPETSEAGWVPAPRVDPDRPALAGEPRPEAALADGRADARELLKQAKALRDRVNLVLGAERDTREQVSTRFRALREAMALRDLGQMDLERLKDTSADRLPLLALRKAGFSTVGQLVEVRPAALAALPGIAELTANRVVAAAKALAEAAQESLGIRIDLDPGNSQATELLAWLRHAVTLADTIDPRRNAAETVASQLPGLLTQAGPTRSRTRLFLAGKERRRLAGEALAGVAEILAEPGVTGLAGGLGEAVTAARSRVEDTGVWTDFERAAVRYYGLLGEIINGGGASQAGTGFLPAEIVEGIRRQQLDGAFRKVSLRGYQAFGAKFALAQRRALIGDEMGLGKTVQAIAAMAHLRALDRTHFLVVCPASVLVNWLREVERHSTLTAHRLHGADRAAQANRWLARGGVAVTTYDTLGPLNLPERIATGSGSRWGPRSPAIAMLVADEAHYVKNTATKRSTAPRALIDRSDLVDRVLFLSGTPMENHVAEFRTLVGYLQPHLVPPDQRRLPGNDAGISPVRFRVQIAPAYLRRNVDEVLSELPETVHSEEWLEFCPAERAAYRQAVLGRQFMAMRQVAFDAAPERSEKLARLAEIVQEAGESGQRTVVFSYFLGVLDAVGARLRREAGAGRVFGPIRGNVAPERRQQMIDEFSASPAPAVLLSQISAGGTGLNMQAASVVILCEPQVKPSLETQAVARLRRLGQVRTVRVHRLLTTDSVDQRLVDILAAKSADFDAYARRSSLADAGPDAFDVSDEALVRKVVEEEYLRMAMAAAGPE